MTILETIIKWAIPTILTGVLGYIVKQLKDNKNNNRTMKESMVLLLWSQINEKCEKYLELGYLPSHARTCLEELFKQYASLGGNHGLEILVNEAFELPPMKK